VRGLLHGMVPAHVAKRMEEMESLKSKQPQARPLVMGFLSQKRCNSISLGDGVVSERTRAQQKPQPQSQPQVCAAGAVQVLARK